MNDTEETVVADDDNGQLDMMATSLHLMTDNCGACSR